MKNLSVRSGELQDWKTIQQIGLKTFVDAFCDKNSAENINDYVNWAFSEQKIKQELQNPNSFFYLFYLKEELIGYLK